MVSSPADQNLHYVFQSVRRGFDCPYTPAVAELPRRVPIERELHVEFRAGKSILGMGLLVLLGCLLGSCGRQPAEADTAYGRGGQPLWIELPAGRLKAEAFSSTQLSEHPLLLIVLHGDLFDPTPSYQYAFAQLVTQGANAPALPENTRASIANWRPIQDVVAVGILRPGYTDNRGDRSDGDMGNASLDNFTPEVVDAIGGAVNQLKERFGARYVVLVGHSGGAAIAANILGRHPESANAALLVACACDPDAARARTRQTRGSPIWQGPTRSLQPLTLVPNVRGDAIIRVIVGEEDDMGLREDSLRYSHALRERGVNAQITIAPSLGHNILLTAPVLAGVAELLHP